MEFNVIKEVSVGSQITRAGIEKIEALLGFPLPDTFDWSKGEKNTRITRRISLYAKKVHNLNLSKDSLTAIGNIHNQHSVTQETHLYDFNNTLDWTSGAYGDYGSCFWGGRSAARKIIRAVDGFALRTYTKTKADHYQGVGRCWIIPQDKDFFLFNAYGHGLNVFAEIFQKSQDLPHSKSITLTNEGRSDGTLYINRSVGYVIGHTEHKAKAFDLKIKPSIWLLKEKIRSGVFQAQFCEMCGKNTWHENGHCTGTPVE